MAVAAVENCPNSAMKARYALGILAAATLGGLVPFLNKAFCIDDPLFLWSAAQIQGHPLDFYGCQVNWYGQNAPLYDTMKNPPAACYYLAVVASFAGWNEVALHLAFLVPAIGSIWGTWVLARSFCNQPVAAALAALATPAFLVSSTNVMCDTMMLCFWTWAIVLWIKGLDSGHVPWMFCASLLIVVAALTKYFAISLIPLLAVYMVIRQGRPTRKLLWMLIPIIGLAGYQWWTWQSYGRGLLSDAAAYARYISTDSQSVSVH